MKYVKKPIVIEAFQFGGEHFPDWFAKEVAINYITLHGGPPASGCFTSCKIPTLEGTMEAYKGDMIIKGIKGEIYPCKKDIFDASYEVYKENENRS